MSEASDDSRITVLVVDDDRAFCRALASSLRRRGFVVVVAHSYEEALAEAKARSPKRAVIDLRMPGRSGLELVAGLRRIDPSIAVVMLTGYGSTATASEAIKLGAVGYMTSRPNQTTSSALSPAPSWSCASARRATNRRLWSYPTTPARSRGEDACA